MAIGRYCCTPQSMSPAVAGTSDASAWLSDGVCRGHRRISQSRTRSRQPTAVTVMLPAAVEPWQRHPFPVRCGGGDRETTVKGTMCGTSGSAALRKSFIKHGLSCAENCLSEARPAGLSVLGLVCLQPMAYARGGLAGTRHESCQMECHGALSSSYAPPPDHLGAPSGWADSGEGRIGVGACDTHPRVGTEMTPNCSRRFGRPNQTRLYPIVSGAILIASGLSFSGHPVDRDS
jgi:hypothetical protein